MGKFLYFIIMFFITSYFSSNSFRPHIIYRKIKRWWILKKSYIKSDQISYGVPQYDFFDHESTAYLSDLIVIKNIGEDTYDFEKTFDENINKNGVISPKLKEIKDFIDKYYNNLPIDAIINNTIVNNIPEEKNDAIIINQVFKSRKDVKDNMEAASLTIEMVKSDNKTMSLIEGLYNYLAKVKPEAVETHFKTNKTKGIVEEDRYDVMCFLTRLKINGFILNNKINNVKFVVDKNIGFSFGIDFDYQWMDKDKNGVVIDMNGVGIKEKIEQNICQNYSLNIITKTMFTDVAISYSDGVCLNLLGCMFPDKINNNLPENYSIVEIADYEQFRKISDTDKVNSNIKQFAYLYMWSLYRKNINKHL